MMQVAQPKMVQVKVAQPKPAALRPQVYMSWTVPASVKAISKLMLSVLTPERMPESHFTK